MVLLFVAGGLFSLVIYLLVGLALLWLFYYLINNLAPEPYRKILNVVLVVVFVLVLCYLLLGLVGGAPRL